MANEPKMKIGIGADTGDFDKGAKKVKQEMKDLSKVSSDAFGAIGNAIGVDTGKLTQFSSALQGLGRKFTEMGTEGSKAFGSIIQAVGPASVAIAGIGIAAAVAGFKALKSEADAFKNTVEGANLELATAAYISTYKQALFDMRNGLGKDVAETESAIKEWWGRFSANVGNTLGQALKAWRQGLSGPTSLAVGVVSTQASQGPAEQKAARARQISDEIFQLERQRAANMEEIAQLSSKIAAQTRIAREALAAGDAVSAQQAITKAKELIIQKADLEVGVEAKIRDLLEERNSLVSSSVKDIDQATNQAVKVYNIEQGREEALRSLVRMQSSVTTMAVKEAAARTKSAEEMGVLAENMSRVLADKAMMEIDGGAIKADLSTLSNTMKVTAPKMEIVPPKQGNWVGFFDDIDKAFFQKFPNGLAIGVTFEYEKGLIDMSQAVTSTIQSLATTTAEAIGQLVGDLATGGNAWENFANTALSSFGDMAISIGKMAIETGVATLGIKAALESLNGYVAIAAGMALVALGSAVKTGLSNVASGNYSAGMGSYTGGTSSSITNDYESRDVNVNVTGTLQADGDQLVAVINNSNKKSYYTT